MIEIKLNSMAYMWVATPTPTVTSITIGAHERNASANYFSKKNLAELIGKLQQIHDNMEYNA